MYEIYEKLLKQKGVSTYQVSKATSIAQSIFSAWKNGVSTPKNDKMQKIADYFGVSLTYMLTGDGGGLEQESTSGQKYYFDDDTAEKAQELFENSDMRILFDAAQDSRPEDLQMAADLLKRLKETNPDG